jgi:MFS family permease
LIDYFNGYDMSGPYAIWSSLSILLGGTSGYLFAGYLSDKLEERNYRTKSYIGVVMSLLAVPLLLCCFLVQTSFAFDMFCFFLYEFFSDGWQAPNIAMIQYLIDIKYKAIAIGVFFLGTTLSGTAASTIVGALIGNADNNMH